MADPGIGVVELRVRYAETDQMGLAHHRHYLAWCELGRTALMRERGMPYGELERRGILLPVTRAVLEYRDGARFDERVRVETRIERVRSRGVSFRYLVLRVEDGAVLARVRTELVCTDRSGRSRRLPADLRAALSGSNEPAGGESSESGESPGVS